MKKLLIVNALLLSLANPLFSQRLIPILEEGEQLTFLLDTYDFEYGPNGDVVSMLAAEDGVYLVQLDNGKINTTLKMVKH